MRSLFTVATVVAAFTSTACADTAAPVDGPAFSRSADRCMNVAGTIVGNVFAPTAPVTGTLQGLVSAWAPPQFEMKGPSLHLSTFHEFHLADGAFRTVDRGVQAPMAPPVYRLNNRYEVVSGTGAWEGASGFVHVHGTLVIDLAFQDPRNGDIDVTYRGRVCRS